MYTNLELLRKQIADPFKFATDKQVGDGVTLIYKLSHERIQDSTFEVFVDEIGVHETTDFVVDLDRGIFTFVVAPEADKEIRINYNFAAFSDIELTEFLTLSNDSVDGACIRCIDILLIDSARRFDYSAGQTEIKASQVFNNLMKLREMFQKRFDVVSQTNLQSSTGGVKMINRIDSHFATPSSKRIKISEESRDYNDLSRSDL